MKYRHGDMALISVEKLPEGLKKSNSKILMKGSHGNNHSFENGEFYPQNKNRFVFGYLVAKKNCCLFHITHGKKTNGKRLKKAKIKTGIYELRKQQEDTHVGLEPVLD